MILVCPLSKAEAGPIGSIRPLWADTVEKVVFQTVRFGGSSNSGDVLGFDAFRNWESNCRRLPLDSLRIYAVD